MRILHLAIREDDDDVALHVLDDLASSIDRPATDDPEARYVYRIWATEPVRPGEARLIDVAAYQPPPSDTELLEQAAKHTAARESAAAGPPMDLDMMIGELGDAVAGLERVYTETLARCQRENPAIGPHEWLDQHGRPMLGAILCAIVDGRATLVRVAAEREARQ